MTGGISEGIFAQSNLFLLGMQAGIQICLVYDLIRLLRRVIPHGTAGMAAEDGIYFFCCTLVCFERLYDKSLGEMKGFLVMAFVVGALVYRLILGRYLMAFGTRWIRNQKARFLRRKKKGREKEKETRNTIEK